MIGFGSSSNLAAAYGVAVTTTMVITTVLFSFWGANLVKIPDGGWFPLVVAALVFTLMTTWKTGHQILAARVKAGELPVQHFIDSIAPNPPHRVPGTAVFMSSDPEGRPPAILHNLKHNKVLHEQVIFLAVLTEEVPHVQLGDRADVNAHGQDFFGVVLGMVSSKTWTCPWRSQRCTASAASSSVRCRRPTFSAARHS